MNKKKTPWIILLIVGIMPFVIALGGAAYAALAGFNGLAITSPLTYGWPAFRDWIVLWSFVYWPTYVVGGICIAISLIKLKK